MATRVVLKTYVKSGFAELSNFSIDHVPAPSRDQLKSGEALIRPLYLSVDPHQRGRMGGQSTYVGGYKTGEPITNYLVARVAASASSAVHEGDLVYHGEGKWQTEYIVKASDLTKLPDQEGINPRDYLGVLGVTSFTAFYGFQVRGCPKAGETILVTSAAGGVGQIVVQLAKIHGLYVIGVAGSDEKVEYVKQIGADKAFNYKTCGDYATAIKKAAPEGVDMYFDNVGGPFLDAVLLNLKNGARIIGCGITSQKNVTSANEQYGLKNLFYLISKEATLVGINVSGHFNSPIHDEFVSQISNLYREGKVKFKIAELDGIEKAPQALLDLYDGTNFGKSIVKV
ncbi:allyl alcohol dehydrogenase [Coemansia reversa NRRL 1564]|uniref:Allyl alcohol dehydrogenase n=1 Tax=Coemansia reversa (strain ATCC 12441 / NRRL 1564) TaxID=763665 RepID=A0A2G5B7F8_COERN|nr:allyl alcohol dehydrogenase [Coemansia reversa NRRL 1564]|eukprot:PIA14948.1 allyl alcohol dehydrogenase [Coemansia reversa NRRL 1564]